MVGMAKTPGAPRKPQGTEAEESGRGARQVRRRGAATHERAYARDRSLVLRRLARMEGQVRGVARMIEREDACVDILQQTAALRAAVDAVAMMLMEDHVAGCLRTAVRTGDADSYADEVMDVVRRSLGRPTRSSRSTSEP